MSIDVLGNTIATVAVICIFWAYMEYQRTREKAWRKFCTEADAILRPYKAEEQQAERAALVAEIAAAVVKAIADKEEAQRTGDVAVLQAMMGKVVKP